VSLTSEHRRRVALFDEMTGVLLDSRFVQRVLGGGPVATTLSWEQGPDGGSMTVATDGPDNESVRALVLTIRMFIQDRDGISFGQMREIYDDPSVPPDLRGRFHGCRDGINQFLDAGPSGVSLNHNGQILTRREILDVVVYGGLSHANPKKRALYEQWRAGPPWFALVWDSFVETLAGLCGCARDIRDLNAELPGGASTAASV
jgi:hypothetical protein